LDTGCRTLHNRACAKTHFHTENLNYHPPLTPRLPHSHRHLLLLLNLRQLPHSHLLSFRPRLNFRQRQSYRRGYHHSSPETIR
jgi:hypothetical protein